MMKQLNRTSQEWYTLEDLTTEAQSQATELHREGLITLCGSLCSLCVSVVKVVSATLMSQTIECPNVICCDLVNSYRPRNSV